MTKWGVYDILIPVRTDTERAHKKTYKRIHTESWLSG